MKNAALCEALPLLATCSHEIPPTPHMVCFAFPPPRIITIPEQNSHFWIRVASRCVIIIDPRLLRLFSCSRPQQLPRDKNQSFAKPSFSFFLPRYYRLSKLPWPSLSAVLFCSHVHCQFPHFFPLLLYINFSTWKKWLEEWRHREEAYADILRFLLFLFSSWVQQRKIRKIE